LLPKTIRIRRPGDTTKYTEYARAIRDRYRQSNKDGKTNILDEFTKTTGLHRKATIMLLNKDPLAQGRKKREDHGNMVVSGGDTNNCLGSDAFYFDPMVCVLPLAIEAKMPKKHKTAMMINAIRMLFKKSG
jgi:hypothetical protein